MQLQKNFIVHSMIQYSFIIHNGITRGDMKKYFLIVTLFNYDLALGNDLYTNLQNILALTVAMTLIEPIQIL